MASAWLKQQLAGVDPNLLTGSNRTNPFGVPSYSDPVGSYSDPISSPMTYGTGTGGWWPGHTPPPLPLPPSTSTSPDSSTPIGQVGDTPGPVTVPQDIPPYETTTPSTTGTFDVSKVSPTDVNSLKSMIDYGLKTAYGRQATDKDYNYWITQIQAKPGDMNYWLQRLLGQGAGGADTALYGPYAGQNAGTFGSSGGAGGGASPSLPIPPFTSSLKFGVDSGPNKQLYDMLIKRATQSLAVNRNDPIIRAQSDAFGAQQTKSARHYLSDIAERVGPIANIGAERRSAAETVGQNTSAFEAQLMGQELSARRNEIAQALTSMQGFLTSEQQMALQQELAALDRALQYYAHQQQNNQFNANLGQNAFQFDINDEYRRSPLAS